GSNRRTLAGFHVWARQSFVDIVGCGISDRIAGFVGSEQILQCKLNHSRPRYSGSRGPENPPRHPRNAHYSEWVPQIGVVKSIEQLKPELNSLVFLSDSKILRQGEVEGGGTGAFDNVSACIAKMVCRCLRKARLVKPSFSSRITQVPVADAIGAE